MHLPPPGPPSRPSRPSTPSPSVLATSTLAQAAPRSEFRTVAGGSLPHALAYSVTEPELPGAHDLALLLMHGAWHSKECYEQGFTELLAARGWRTLAMSYRGHGCGATASEGDYRQASLGDYAADARAVITDATARGLLSAPEQVILIAHSMGGPVALEYLAAHPATGAVLLCSTTSGLLAKDMGYIVNPLLKTFPRQAGRVLWRSLVRHDPNAFVADLSLATWLFINAPASHQAPDVAVASELDAATAFYAAHHQHESARIMPELLRRSKQPAVATEIRVPTGHLAFVRATADRMVPAGAVEAAAALYAQHSPRVVDIEGPHCLMLAGDTVGAVAAIDAFACAWEGVFPATL